MSGCLNFFRDSVNKDTAFSIKVLGWLFNISYTYTRKSIYLSGLRCNFTVKLIFSCIDLVLSLFLFHSVTGVCSRHLFYALKILQKLISLLVSVLLLVSLADPSRADSSGGSFWDHIADLPA